MKFMITYEYTPDRRGVAIERFRQTQGVPPEGVSLLGRWHRVAGNAGFLLVESEEGQAVADLILGWSDILSFDVMPVVDDDELAELLEEMGD